MRINSSIRKVLGLYILDRKILYERRVSRLLVATIFLVPFVLAEFSLLAILLTVGTYFRFYIFLGFKIASITVSSPTLAILLNTILYGIFLIISVAFIVKGKGLVYELSSRNYSWEPLSVTESFFLAFFLSIALVFIFPSLPRTAPGETTIIMVYNAIFLAPLSEEISYRFIILLLPVIIKDFILYRGENPKQIIDILIDGKEDIDILDWILIGISGGIFGVAHYVFGWSFNKIFQATLLGIFLGYIAVKRGLVASIIFHFVWNSLSILAIIPLFFDLPSIAKYLISTIATIWIIISIITGIVVLVIFVLRIMGYKTI